MKIAIQAGSGMLLSGTWKSIVKNYSNPSVSC
jgi:hypothetical protein